MDKGIKIKQLAIDYECKPTYIYNAMATISIQFEKADQGYNVSINEGEMNQYSSREETWDAIYSSVKDHDFSKDVVEFNGIPVPAIDRLIILVKHLF
jgi:hypothetical protein